MAVKIEMDMVLTDLMCGNFFVFLLCLPVQRGGRMGGDYRRGRSPPMRSRRDDYDDRRSGGGRGYGGGGGYVASSCVYKLSGL